MPLFLSQRNEELIEWMERSGCDADLLFNTYQQFGKINRILSGWSRIYKYRLKPLIEENNGKASILDIGCGGGDIIRMLNRLSRRDGFDIQFTGIDPDKRAMKFLNGLEKTGNISFKGIMSAGLADANKRFDIVISNHLVHHLDPPSLKSLCHDAEKLAVKLVLFSDIERSDIGYAAFACLAPLIFRRSYIVKDGLISIKRSFRKPELQRVLPPGWKVSRSFPFRLIATYKPGQKA